MKDKLSQKAMDAFILVDVYRADSRDDILRLIDETKGTARTKAEKLLNAYDAYADMVSLYYDEIVVPSLAEDPV